jgi:hypothetical protein
VRAAAGEVVVPPRAEVDLDEAGSVMPYRDLKPRRLRYATALVGVEAEDHTVEISTRLAGSRRSTGLSVEALVRREGAVRSAPRRGAHRRRRPLPRRTRLLVAAVGTAAAAASTSTVVLMLDHGGSPRVITGQAHAEAPRLDVPSAGPSASADEAEPQVVNPDQLAALSRPAAAVPTPVPMPSEPTRPAQSLDPTPSPSPTQETAGTTSGSSKGAESRGGGTRGSERASERSRSKRLTFG